MRASLVKGSHGLLATFDPNAAVTALRHLALGAGNIVGLSPAAGPEGVIQHRDRYLAWVDEAESQLTQMFGTGALADLHTARYRDIRGLDIYGARPIALVNHEVTAQRDRLNIVADDLDRVHQPFRGQATVYVIDTNVFLQYHTFNDVTRWCAELDSNAIVVVPLRVVQELDAKKTSNSKRLRKRADKVLREMERRLEDSTDATLREGVLFRVFMESDSWDASADEEILTVAHLVQLYARRPVQLVTSDLSMRLRAVASGIRCLRLPDSLLLPPDKQNDNDDDVEDDSSAIGTETTQG